MIEEKEIDLAHLLSKFRSFIRAKIYILGISFVIVAAGVYAMNYAKPKEFSSKLVISSNQYPFAISQEILNSLVEAVRNKNGALFNKKLGILDGDISPVKKMSLKEVRLPINEAIASAISIDLTVQSEDNRVKFDTVIVNYMNRSEFVQENINAKKQSLQNHIKNIKGQIKRLDSTQLFLINKLGSSNSSVNIENFDLGSIYQQMIFLDKELNDAVEKLDTLVEFKVVSFIEVTSKSLFWKYAIMGIILWVLFLMFLFVRYIW